MNPGERRFRSEDGQEWRVSIEPPEIVMSVAPELVNSGAMLPQESARIVFRSGSEVLSEEFTGLGMVEDLSEEDLRTWFRAARRGRGL